MTHRSLLPALLALALATLTAAAPARAGDMVQVGVLPGWRAADGTHVAGLTIRLAPGWKTYWRSPGDAGIPPQIDWAGSVNLADVTIQWPVPVTFDINGMTSVGYKRDVTLPLRVTPVVAGQPIRLEAQVTLGVCDTICVPVDVHLRADLPSAAATPDPRLIAALAALPEDAAAARVGRVTCRLSPTATGVRLDAELAMPALGGTEFTVVETADPEIWVGEATTRRIGDRLHVSTEMEHGAGLPIALDRSGLRLTVLSGPRGAEIRGCD